MGQFLDHVVEVSFTLILVYLILNNATGFSSVLSTAGNVYVQSVKALQGR